MKRHCDKCDIVYDDFNRDTDCPHLDFQPSESARKHLTEIGICWRCGEKSGVADCPVEACPLRAKLTCVCVNCGDTYESKCADSKRCPKCRTMGKRHR